MNLVIDQAGKKIFAFTIDLGNIRSWGCNACVNPFYPPVFYKDICGYDPAFIDYLNIFYQVYLHNLLTGLIHNYAI